MLCRAINLQSPNYMTIPLTLDHVALHEIRQQCVLFVLRRLVLQVFMHGHSMVSVYKCIDMALLPEEYLPDDFEEESVGSVEQITGNYSN